MGDEIEATLLDPYSESFPGDVDALREAVGAPNNVHLIPPHFLKATLPKIGGKIATITRGGEPVGAGFLFPRGDGPESAGFTLRLHWKDHSAVAESDAESAAASLPEEIRLAGVTAYDPTAPLAMTGSVVYQDGDLTIETPDAKGAEEIRWLQDQIWKPEIDYLYPVDIHSPAFRPGTSLVARVGGEPVAFLFGFYKLGGPKLPARLAEAYRTDLRLESQLMGVLPAHRARGLGFLLKKTQAILAQQDGLDVVNWTVDPLQYGNAVLNFSKLRGIAFDHYPDYYAFRNALNQTAASRFNITLLVRSPHVQEALDGGGQGRPVDLADRPERSAGQPRPRRPDPLGGRSRDRRRGARRLDDGPGRVGVAGAGVARGDRHAAPELRRLRRRQVRHHRRRPRRRPPLPAGEAGHAEPAGDLPVTPSAILTP